MPRSITGCFVTQNIGEVARSDGGISSKKILVKIITAKKTYEIFPISLLKNYRSVGISPIATATQGMQSIAFVKIPAYPLGFSTEPLL
ncbi:unknown [Bacteroides sp. CAG:20]|nr:unknown [Bacteroides sp. CAG:20]